MAANANPFINSRNCLLDNTCISCLAINAPKHAPTEIMPLNTPLAVYFYKVILNVLITS